MSPQSLNMTDRASKEKEFIRIALKLLSLRDHFSYEIIEKLKSKGATAEEVDAVMEYVGKYNYIDDFSTLGKYALELASKFKGFYYLKKKLFEKGCQELVVRKDLRIFYTLEMEKKAVIEWIKKNDSFDVPTIEKKLASRGFSSEAIYEVTASLKKKKYGN